MINKIKIKEALKGVDISKISIDELVDSVVDETEKEMIVYLQGEAIGNGLHKLPRDSKNNLHKVFKTKNHTYKILDATETDWTRWSVFEQSQLSFGFAKPFQTIYNAILDIKKSVLGKTTLAKVQEDVLLIVKALEDGIIELSEQRQSSILEAACFLIIREDEDITKPIDEGIHREKMEDFAAHFTAYDFFLLLLNQIDGLVEVYQKLEERNQKLKQVIGL